MPRPARVFALAAHLVVGIAACGGHRAGPVPPGRAEAPAPFAVAPDFRVPDSAGTPRGLADLAGPNGLVLVTYRGHW